MREERTSKKRCPPLGGAAGNLVAKTTTTDGWCHHSTTKACYGQPPKTAHHTPSQILGPSVATALKLRWRSLVLALLALMRRWEGAGDG